MSILFDDADPIILHNNKIRPRNQQDERYLTQPGDNSNDILVFGYQCKLFRDNQVATDVNCGKFLIPWMGNKDLMIDRYDCRGHLYRMEEFDFEKMGEFSPLSPERLDIENVCDEERYIDLKCPISSDEAILLEEEDKRGSALYDPFTAYQNIEYSYGNSSNEKNSTSDDSSAYSKSNFDNETYVQFCQYYGYDPDDSNIKAYFLHQGSYQYDYERPPPPSEPHPTKTQLGEDPNKSSDTSSIPYEKFVPPVGIMIPKEIEVPETKKMQAIIEKTAVFISKQSAQMEIVLKTKQSGNPQFAFLDFDNYLNPYYKLILRKIKDGEYLSCNYDKKDENLNKGESLYEKPLDESEEDSDGDENELHPLLQAHRRPLNNSIPSPPEIPDVSVNERIINPVLLTKPTGKIEDLAKVYMTWKYNQNPGDTIDINKDESLEKNEEKLSLNDVNELPPPPLPPPPNFVLAKCSHSPSHLVSITDVSVEFQSLPEQLFENGMSSKQYNIEQTKEETINKHTNIATHILQTERLIDSPIVVSQLSQPLFSQIRFQSVPVCQPPYYDLSSHPIPVNLTNSQFLHLPHQLQFSHPQNLYQVRSSVPPPPPPPLPSLMPPGVDVLPICSTNNQSHFINPDTDKDLDHKVIPISFENHQVRPPFPVFNPVQQSSSQQESLLPPGVDTDSTSEKLSVPPPPLPPLLPPSIDCNNEQTISNFEIGSITEVEESNISNSNNVNLHSHSNNTIHVNQDNLHPKETKRRKKSSKKNILLEHSRDEHLSDSSSNFQLCTNQSFRNDFASSYNQHIKSHLALSSFEVNQKLDDIQKPFNRSTHITADDSTMTFPTKIITPGKDLQLVIDRLALYVSKNGDEFEIGIKEKKDPRFDFLNPWNIYHPYYSNKKLVNLGEVIKDTKDEECQKNSKVKFGLKSKMKPVTVAQNKSATAAASVFNQNEEEDESTEGSSDGFQPNKDPELEVKRKLQKQIEEKEKLLKQLHEQALLQQKIAEVNRQASIKPMLQHLTPEQQAMLKKKVQENEHLKKDNMSNPKQDERKKRVASFVGMLKKNSTSEQSSDLAGNFLRKRQFKETSGSKDTEAPDKASYEKKKDAFFKAINDAFKGT